MTKKKVILLAVAALFAVSGLTALPSGNITGGAGCIVVAAVCAYFGLKKKNAGKENRNRTPAPAAASGGRILDTIRTKVVGVTFNNEDGENRQDILSRMSGSEDITVEKYTYNGEPAAYVKWGDKVIGNLSAELAGDLARKYPKARYTAEILEISGGFPAKTGPITWGFPPATATWTVPSPALINPTLSWWRPAPAWAKRPSPSTWHAMRLWRGTQ